MHTSKFAAILALLLSYTASVAHAQSVTVTLNNENFSSVLVEAQIEGGNSLGTRSLTKGQSWPISCPKGGAVLYRSREQSADWGEWIRASCGFDFGYRISDGGRTGGANSSNRGCDALASRGASASHSRLTDGVVGSTSPGQNSGRPGGTFWVELSQPESVHHITLHPYNNGTAGSTSIVGYDSGGAQTTLATSQTGYSSAPFSISVDTNKGKNIKKIEVNVTPSNGKDWVAFTEIQVFVCR
jgi:hypothetical protein